MIEIERKFLVKTDEFKTESFDSKRLTQGFLNRDKNRTVRVRIQENTGVLTIKGLSTPDGVSRFEWEKIIPLHEAKALFKLCEKGIIDKIRYRVKVAHHIFEVDEFLGDNTGLTLAEIELKSETEVFKKPQWLGKEVTGEVRYYNSQLSKTPFKDWKNKLHL